MGQACYDNAADKGSFVAGQANDWWTRTIDWGYGNRAMRITYNGSSSNQYCNGFIGVRPFCNLSGNVKLSLTADSDGVYDIVAFV